MEMRIFNKKALKHNLSDMTKKGKRKLLNELKLHLEDMFKNARFSENIIEDIENDTAIINEMIEQI